MYRQVDTNALEEHTASIFMFTLKMAVLLFGRLVPTHQTTWCHEPEEHHRNSLIHEIQLCSSTKKCVLGRITGKWKSVVSASLNI
jgi:hypothetical protein